MNIKDKSKDTGNACRDLANIGLMKELHLQYDRDYISMNLACYMLNLNE